MWNSDYKVPAYRHRLGFIEDHFTTSGTTPKFIELVIVDPKIKTMDITPRCKSQFLS